MTFTKKGFAADRCCPKCETKQGMNETAFYQILFLMKNKTETSPFLKGFKKPVT